METEPYVEDFEQITEPFWRTYGKVDEALIKRVKGDPCQRWMFDLMVGFKREFDRWRYERKDFVRAYTNSSKFTRLIGFAYLHMGYDLPRILADHWPPRERQPADVVDPFKPWDVHNTQIPVYEEQWRFYCSLNRVLAEVYRSAIPLKRLTNTVFLGAPMLPLFWMFLMRERAWLLASELVAAGPEARPELENRILTHVTDRGLRFAVTKPTHLASALHQLEPAFAAAPTKRVRPLTAG